MEHETITYGSLLIIALLAAFVPLILNKLKWNSIPLVVGEIVAGMIVGKSGFNLIEQTEWLNFLYTFGFAFLMFLSGLEVDFKLIKSLRKNGDDAWYGKPIVSGSIIFAGTLVMASVIAILFKRLDLIKNVPLVTLILSTTSLGIVVPTLKEKNYLNSEYGQTILITSLIADFVTMILITIYISMYTSAGSYKFLLVFVMFVVFFEIYHIGRRFGDKNLLKGLVSTTSQIKVRGAFALILIFMALAKILGTEVILGTFLAGMIVSLLDEKDTSQLSSKLDAIGYGFFVPIFFIMVGANFDIRGVINNPKAILLIPGLLVALYLVKLLPALILSLKYGKKKAISAGFLLSSRLSLIIAASEIGVKLDIISKELNSAIILIAIITCTISPFVFNKMMPALKDHTVRRVFMIGIKQKTLLLARRLKKENVEITFITHNEQKYEEFKDEGYNIFLGDTLDMAFLKSTGIEKADTVVIYKTFDDLSAEICEKFRDNFGEKHILLLANSQTNILEENKYGATVISPEFATVSMAENLILHPKSYSMLFSEDDEDFKLSEITLRNPAFVNQAIKNIRLPGDCLILSIIRQGMKIIPNGNNILRLDDVIMLVGSNENIAQAEIELGKEF